MKLDRNRETNFKQISPSDVKMVMWHVGMIAPVLLRRKKLPILPVAFLHFAVIEWIVYIGYIISYALKLCLCKWQTLLCKFMHNFHTKQTNNIIKICSRKRNGMKPKLIFSYPVPSNRKPRSLAIWKDTKKKKFPSLSIVILISLLFNINFK